MSPVSLSKISLVYKFEIFVSLIIKETNKDKNVHF